MKTSCTLTALGAATLFGLYVWAFHGRVELPAELVLALFGTVGALVGIGGVTGLLQARRDARLLAAGPAGPLTDGEQVAAAGTIVPLGEPLRSPFLGEACVAYEYEVFRWTKPSRRRGKGAQTPQKVMDFSGFALTPAVIRTPRGDVRLLGYPVLDQFPATSVTADKDLERAAAYLAAAPAEEMGSFRPGKIFSEVKDLLSDDDGAVRKDWRMCEPTSDLAGRHLSERVVRPHERVCALGHYSAARGGLVPSLGTHGSVNRLIPGEAEAVRRRLVGEARSKGILSLVIFLVLHGMLAGLFLLSGPKLSRAAFKARNHSIHFLAQEGDVAVLEELLAAGKVEADTRDGYGASALFYTHEREVIQVLLRHGADPNARDGDGDTLLMEAARSGDLELARLLIDGGADVNAVNEQWGSPRTALVDAVESGASGVEALLLEKGARDDRVSASNGTPLPADGGAPFAVCRAYLEAIHRGDVEGMRAVRRVNRGDFFDNVDWALWQATRPAEPRLVEGFFNAERATLTLTGATARGAETRWVYQLERVTAEAAPTTPEAAPGGGSGVWGIVREWEVGEGL